MTLELVAAARAYAGGDRSRVAIALAAAPDGAPLAASLARIAGEVFVVEHRALAEGSPVAQARALAAVARHAGPDLILVGQTARGRDVAPALAQLVGGGVVMNAIEIRAADAAGEVDVVCPVYGGAVRAVYRMAGAGPRVVGFQPHLVDPVAPSGAEVGIVTRVGSGLGDDYADPVKVIGRSVAGGPRLEDARIVVAGGLGLGEKENFRYVEELAALLGGMPAASRPVVDRGWAPSALQVGLTGKAVAPELYFAIGISGASQHIAGMSAAKHVVAVNSDPKATIFDHARYGVVADCLEFLPAFLEACRRLPPTG